MSTTESAARAAISAVEAAPAPTPASPASSNAHEYPQLAAEEMDHRLADDPGNPTRRIAAAMTVLHDERPYVSTAQGMARRQFYDDGDRTRQLAREAIDLAAWAEGQQADPRDRAALAAHGFAADVNKGAMEGVLSSGGSVFEPGSDQYREAADAVIDAIIAHRGQR